MRVLVAVRKGVYLTPQSLARIGFSLNFLRYLINDYGDTPAVASPNKHLKNNPGGAVIVIIL
jgi:hypothetical protein